MICNSDALNTGLLIIQSNHKQEAVGLTEKLIGCCFIYYLVRRPATVNLFLLNLDFRFSDSLCPAALINFT